MPDTFIENWAYVEIAKLRNPREVLQDCTVIPKQFSGNFEPCVEPIHVYDRSRESEGLIGLPIEYAIRKFPGNTLVDRTSKGAMSIAPFTTRTIDFNHPRASAGQERFAREFLCAAEHNYTMLNVAGTGTGKTVVALWVAQQFDRPVVVLTHLERLADQWEKEIIEKLGVAPENVGRIQGIRFDWKKPFVIAMMPTIIRRTLPDNVKNHFGTAIWDEVHKVGAPMFAKTLGQFNAERKWALTATKKRRDGCDRVYFLQFGTGTVTSTSESLPIKVHAVAYKSRPISGKIPSATVLNMIAKDDKRNHLILSIWKKLIEHKRQVLIIGDRREQLFALAKLAQQKLGVKPHEIGFFVGQDAQGKRPGGDYYSHISRACPYILATYGMMKEGIDIPRLDAGIEATPRSEAIQVLGRVRRPMPGKPVPVWYTLVDMNTSMLKSRYHLRRKEYVADRNIELREHFN